MYLNLCVLGQMILIMSSMGMLPLQTLRQTMPQTRRGITQTPPHREGPTLRRPLVAATPHMDRIHLHLQDITVS